MNMNVPNLVPVLGVGAEERDKILERQRQLLASASNKAVNFDPDNLVKNIVAAFRSHGHICNVMTHISGTQWDQVENALRVILDPRTERQALNSLAENIVDLLCANRGVTGRIVKPYFESLLAKMLPSDVATWICIHVGYLFDDLESQSRGTIRLSRGKRNEREPHDPE